MYIPKHFEIVDDEAKFAFIQENGFGQLVSTVNDRPFSTHVPFMLSDDRRHLLGHLAKQNPQWRELEGQEVLVSLQGPHAYISPSWYLSADVPTWNYQAVHIYGRCTLFQQSDRLKAVVDQLTAQYEAGFETPWQPTYDGRMLHGIVGVEIEISEIQCKYKLNQNKSAGDRQAVAKQLNDLGETALAAAMKT